MRESGPVGAGLIGAGMTSDTYPEKQSAKYQIPEFGGIDEVLSHADVDLVVNLTIPAVHAQVSSEAIAARKHVRCEKPISIDRPSGQALLESAEKARLLVGVAPDTVLRQGRPDRQTSDRARRHR